MGGGCDGKWERLGEFVTQLMEQKQVPGVAVGILHRGEIAAAGFGVTSVEHPLPVTDGTLFQIGSITKTFVATAITCLAERGDLDLDVPLQSYVTSFRVADEEASAGATLRHLLTHTGGWAGDFFHDTGGGDDALACYVADMTELPQQAPLGALWSYNNSGFSLAGYVVELLTGKSFPAALRDLVLEPLGLGHSFLEPGEVMTHRFAVGHNVAQEGPQVARPWPLPRSAYPAGGIVSDLHDLLRYARFHLGDGHARDGSDLLSPSAIAKMQTPQVMVWGDEAWGLGWALAKVGGVRQVSHGGGTKGQVTLLALVPDRNFALAVLTNADRGGVVTEKVRLWALKEYLGLESPEPQPIEVPEEELAQYVGLYQGYFTDLELGMLAGKLVGQLTYKRGFPNEEIPPQPSPPPMSMGLCEQDRLLVLDGEYKDAKGDAIRRQEGSIGWLRMSGRLHVRKA